jgi:hypothetical protein
MNIDSFTVDSVMVHDVPRGNDEADDLTLTDDPIELDRELRSYFRTKIVTSLTERGIEVAADDDEDATAREAIARVLVDGTELAEASRAIATRLNDVQTGRNSPGLLAVISGSLEGKPCVSVLKLEREQGLRFRIRTVDGRSIVDLQFLRDLTLTDKTKVFKTSVFVNGGPGSPTARSLVGQVSDDQRGSETTAGVASFFLGRFLGCRLRDSPEKTTLEFVQAFDAFVNDEVESAERRGRYQIALLATMQDHTGEIRPKTFANTHLDAADRPAFLARVREAGIEPAQAFPKDISLVKVNGFRMTFRSGMVLVGSQDDLSDRVHIRPDNARKPGVEVNDVIRKLKGR